MTRIEELQAAIADWQRVLPSAPPDQQPRIWREIVWLKSLLASEKENN